MNDLDELLRSDATEWQPPHAPVPDLDAALARASARRSKLHAGAALLTVVALAVGGVVVANQFAGIPAVPEPLGVPSTPAVTPTADPAPSKVAPVDPLAGLTDAVHEYASTRGVPAHVTAVLTTWGKALEFLPPDSGDKPTTARETAVWVVRLQGEFSCDDCPTTPGSPEPSTSSNTLVLTADGFDWLWFDIVDATRPLEDLGEVVTLDPDGSTGMLSFTRAAYDNGLQFGIPVTGEAVLTTWQQAQEFLPAEGRKAPGRTQVWVVQLHGSFSCDDCQPTQKGEEPSVSVLTLVLDAQSFDRYYAEPGDVTRPLKNLGVVQAVDLESVA